MESKELKENEKLELERTKLLLCSENIIGYTSTIIFFIVIFCSILGNYSDLESTVFIILGTLVFIAGISFALLIEQKAGYYKCSKCEHTYVPENYLKFSMAPHIGRTRYMKCPKCGEKSWQKKVLNK